MSVLNTYMGGRSGVGGGEFGRESKSTYVKLRCSSLIEGFHIFPKSLSHYGSMHLIFQFLT